MSRPDPQEHANYPPFEPRSGADHQLGPRDFGAHIRDFMPRDTLRDNPSARDYGAQDFGGPTFYNSFSTSPPPPPAPAGASASKKSKKSAAAAAPPAAADDGEQWTRVESKRKPRAEASAPAAASTASPEKMRPSLSTAELSASDAAATTSVTDAATGSSSPVTERTTTDEEPAEYVHPAAHALLPRS